VTGGVTSTTTDETLKKTGTLTDETLKKTGLKTNVTGMVVAAIRQVKNVKTARVHRKGRSERTKNVRTTSLLTAMVMSIARRTKAGRKRTRAAGQNLTAVDLVPGGLT
jgi:hypothetical protein